MAYQDFSNLLGDSLSILDHTPQSYQDITNPDYDVSIAAWDPSTFTFSDESFATVNSVWDERNYNSNFNAADTFLSASFTDISGFEEYMSMGDFGIEDMVSTALMGLDQAANDMTNPDSLSFNSIVQLGSEQDIKDAIVDSFLFASDDPAEAAKLFELLNETNVFVKDVYNYQGEIDFQIGKVDWGFMDVSKAALQLGMAGYAAMTGTVQGGIGALTTIGNMFNEEYTIDMDSGTLLKNGGLTNFVDMTLEFITGGRGLDYTESKALTLVEVGNSIYLSFTAFTNALNSIDSIYKSGTAGMQLAVGLNILSSGKGLYDSILLLQSASQGTNPTRDSILLAAEAHNRVLGVLDSTMNDANSANIYDSLEVITAKIAASHVRGEQAEEALNIAMVKKLTLDHVGSMAGSTKYNAVWAGAEFFSPFSAMVPTMFVARLTNYDPTAYWIYNLMMVTEIHNAKFDQFAGDRDFLERSLTGFSF